MLTYLQKPALRCYGIVKSTENCVKRFRRKKSLTLFGPGCGLFYLLSWWLSANRCFGKKAPKIYIFFSWNVLVLRHIITFFMLPLTNFTPLKHLKQVFLILRFTVLARFSGSEIWWRYFGVDDVIPSFLSQLSFNVSFALCYRFWDRGCYSIICYKSCKGDISVYLNLVPFLGFYVA